MAEPRWLLFAAVVLLAAAAVLALARSTQRMLDSPAPAPGPADGESPAATVRASIDLSTRALLANAALTHGLLGSVVLGAGWYADVPMSALGLVGDPLPDLLSGVALGVGLYAANEAAARLVERLGVEHSERLRELLAPETPAEWAALLFVVLPVVAGAEELLFRGALVGALAAGFGLPAWGLALVSSALFGLGHGLQGPGGVLVIGALGFALAAAFVLTGSLWLVLVAHYVINALEFVVHEHLF